MLKGKRLPKSWEKQQYFLLENGYTVCVEWNQAYGEFVKSITKNDAKWLASNGLATLPQEMQWALAWVKPIAPGHWQTIMQPQIERT